MFPHTTVSQKSAKNRLICFHERKVQKSTNDINAVLSDHVECVVLITRAEAGKD